MHSVTDPIRWCCDFFKFFLIFFSLQINNNGPISFGGTMTSFTPQPFPVSGSPPFLTAYWADVDTTPRNGGTVYYRATTNQDLLDRASAHITGLFTQTGRTFEATELFIATWSRVGYFEEHTDLVNSTLFLIIEHRCTKHRSDFNNRLYVSVLRPTDGDRRSFIFFSCAEKHLSGCADHGWKLLLRHLPLCR